MQTDLWKIRVEMKAQHTRPVEAEQCIFTAKDEIQKQQVQTKLTVIYKLLLTRLTIWKIDQGETTYI